MELAQASTGSLPEGTQIAGYAIGKRIGSGGFGEVYRARHTILGRTAAIKVLHRRYSHDPEAVARFVAEARAVNRVSHPGIVEVFDFGTLDDGRQFCVMELVEGQTLREVLTARGRLPLDEALPILRGIAEAVDAAHGAGIAHRDLKPDNVFVLAGGGVKLIDFGLAKLVDDTEPAITRDGTVFGTPFYMSPEQCRGNATDLRTDTYSFGVVAYQLLTGALPFSGDALEVALHHVNDDPVPPSKRCADVPPRADAPILAAMTKEPGDRPAALVAVVDALAGASTMRVPARRGRRGRVALAVATALVLAGGGATAVTQPWRSADRIVLVPGAGGRPAVAVLDFASQPGDGEAWRSDALGEVLEPLLEAGAGWRVLSRIDTHTLAIDLALPARDGHDGATLRAIAAHGPVRYVVSGSIAVDGDRMRVRARLQDAVAGATLAVVERTGDATQITPLAALVASDLRRRTGYAAVGPEEIAVARRVLPRDELVATFVGAQRRRYRNDMRGVRGEIAKVIAVQPDFAPAHVTMAISHERVGESMDAVAAAERAVATSEGLPRRQRYDVASYARVLQLDYSGAYELARALLAERPDDVAIALEAVFMLRDAKRHDEAAELLERLKRLPPPDGQNPWIDWAEGTLARARGEYPEMLVAARRGTERSRAQGARTALVENLALEGEALNAMVKPDQAIVGLEEATRLARDLDGLHLNLYFALKDLYFTLARIDDARRVLGEIRDLRLRKSEIDPDVTRALYTFDLGLLDESAGNVSGALSSCTTAIWLFIAAGEVSGVMGPGAGWADGPRMCVREARAKREAVPRRTVQAARAEVDAARRAGGPALRTALEHLGDALWDAGKYAEAEARFDEVASLYGSTGQQRRVGWSRTWMAEVVLAAGEPARARTIAAQAIEAFRLSAGELGEAYANHVIALAFLDEGDVTSARAAVAPFEAYVAKLQNLEFRVRLLAGAAVVKRDLALADQALAEAVAIDNYTTITRARLMRARVLRDLGRTIEARVELALVLERARKLGHGEWERTAKQMLARL